MRKHFIQITNLDLAYKYNKGMYMPRRSMCESALRLMIHRNRTFNRYSRKPHTPKYWTAK